MKTKLFFIIFVVLGFFANAQPVPSLSFENSDIKAGDTLQFFGNAVSYDTDSVYYSWAFEGGTPATSVQRNPKILYLQSGEYNVTITTFNTKGSNTVRLIDVVRVENVGNDTAYIETVLPMPFTVDSLEVVGSGFYNLTAIYENDSTVALPVYITVPECVEQNLNTCNTSGITNNYNTPYGGVVCINSGQFKLQAPGYPPANKYTWFPSSGTLQGGQYFPPQGEGTHFVSVWVEPIDHSTPPVQYCFEYTVSCNGVTATSEQEGVERNEISVYPNPASDFLQVDFESTKESEFQVFDVAGKEIISGTMQSGEEIETQDLPAGVYIIRLIIGGKICTQQFVKE